MKNKVLSACWLLVRLVLTITAVIFVVNRIELKVVLNELLNIDLYQYFLAVLAFTAIIIASTAHNYIILNAVDVRYKFIRVLKINYLSFFFSLFSMLVGSISRFVNLSGNTGRRGEALFVMIVERIQQILVLSSLLAGVALWNENNFDISHGHDQPSRLILIWIFIGSLFLNILLVTRFNLTAPASFNWKKIQAFNFIHNKADDLIRIKNIFSAKRASIIGSLLTSFCVSMLGCLFFYFIFSAFDVSLEVSALVYIYALVTFIQLIPITIYGLGLREGALILLLKNHSVSAEQSALIGLSMFIPCIIHAMVGGAWFVSSPKTSR